MQKIYIGLYLIVLTILTSSIYFITEKGWVQYRKAASLYSQYEYSSAIPHYLSAISSGVDTDVISDHLALSSKITYPL